MDNNINLFAFITNCFTILLPLLLILFSLRKRVKEVKLAHFAIPSPKHYAPFSPILLSLRSRIKEVRETHFAIPSPKY